MAVQCPTQQNQPLSLAYSLTHSIDSINFWMNKWVHNRKIHLPSWINNIILGIISWMNCVPNYGRLRKGCSLFPSPYLYLLAMWLCTCFPQVQGVSFPAPASWLALWLVWVNRVWQKWFGVSFVSLSPQKALCMFPHYLGTLSLASWRMRN